MQSTSDASLTPASPDVTTTPLQRAQARIAEMRANGEYTVVRLDPIAKAKAHPTSLRKAITAHCFQCVGAGADPGAKQSVRDCKIESCSLWGVRPWQSVQGKSVDQLSEVEIEALAGKPEQFDEDGDE